MTISNQKSVAVLEEQPTKNTLQISIDELREAHRVLNYSAFKLYLYLAGKRDEWDLELNQKSVENEIGIKKTAYHDAVNKLKEKGYLIVKQDKELAFFTRPVRSSERARLLVEVPFN